MIQRFVGSILLIAGTSIGAGMLALPIVTATAGFIPGIVTFLICWMFMLASAFYFLEINLSLPKANMLSLAANTLPPSGKIITWVTYMLLMYSLCAAYITGGAPYISTFIQFTHASIPADQINAILFTAIMGGIISLGVKAVDWCNRIFMAILVMIFFFFIAKGCSFIHAPYLTTPLQFKKIDAAIPVIITAFGYHIVIPTLVTYLHHNREKLIRVIFIGSLIPLIVYAFWELLVFGILPSEGFHGIAEAATQVHPVNALGTYISSAISESSLAALMKLFSILALITSLLGITLSLVHFLKDALHKRQIKENYMIFVALIPSLVFAILFPAGFTFALGFAGIFVSILLGILPTWMCWRGRYTLSLIQRPIVPGGKYMMILVLLFFTSVIVIEMFTAHL